MKQLLIFALLPLLLLHVPGPKEKPSVKLGQLSQIAATTADLKASITWWERLGFHVVVQMDQPRPWVQLTDESILVYLVQSTEQFCRLSYFTNDYAGTLKALKKAHIKSKSQENTAEGAPYRTVIVSPDGQEISIVNMDPAHMYHPQGKTMLTLDQASMMKGENMPTQLGMFGEYCHKVANLKESMAYWEKLGFQSKGINLVPYPWTIMTDGMSIVGLHQTKDWEGSAITYFAPDMGKRLEALKAEGITGKEIGMGPNNVVVTSPEGVKLFLFSLF